MQTRQEGCRHLIIINFTLLSCQAAQASSQYDGSSHQHLIISDCFVTTEKFCLYQVIKKCSTFFTDIKVISHLIARYFNPSNYRELLVYQIWQQCEFDVCTSKYLFNSIADMLNSTLCKFSQYGRLRGGVTQQQTEKMEAREKNPNL